ncbi:MAG: phosphomethylpyrimidine synthase ThiC [Candidatus Omnitrophica bacterium]|nr:phosphomethylpyrimidine synthase ThiC [Candidatus Omnitrophota bacterium]
MTQLERARKKEITKEMILVAKSESLSPEYIRNQIAQGKAVIPFNKNHKPKRVCGIGEGLRTKVNANIGTSLGSKSLKAELKKLKICIDSGVDTVMDLSTGGDLKKIRKAIISKSILPVGSVPIYETVINIVKKRKHISKITEGDILLTFESQVKDGVDFATIHCGLTLEAITRMRKEGRHIDIVSRGGAFLTEWMLLNKRENPFYTNFDKILKLAHQYDVTLSLGDAMRPGSVADATDRAQIHELITLGELARKAWDYGVQVMIEGPGHVPINQIPTNIILQKRLCHSAPFYVLGPLVTDIAPGYDHITSAIGGAIAASYGADFLCYVTPSEHLRLPTYQDVREGIYASRIAAHSADIAKGIKGALRRDIAMSLARKKRDWKAQSRLCINPEKFKLIRKNSSPKDDFCSMCGIYCSLKVMDKLLN